MAPDHGIAHEVMQHSAVESDAGGGFSDRIHSHSRLNPGL